MSVIGDLTKAMLLGCVGLSVALSLSSCSGSSDGAKGSEPKSSSTVARDVNDAPSNVPILDYSGTYEVTSIFRGDSECLDANYNPSGDSAHGGAFLTKCNGGESQKWRVETVTPGLYRLVSQSDGANVCLNGNDRESAVHDGASFTEPCRQIADQTWTIEPTDGYLRLHSRLYADSACLESNEADSKVHAGSVFMDDCQQVSGQYWYLKNA